MSNILPRLTPLRIGEAIRNAAEYLSSFDLSYGHGTATAMDDAAWLVLESAGFSPLEQPDYELPMPLEAIERCESLLVRRATDRIPVAYLVGRTWFAGLEMIVDERALVPRSPIAELVENEFHGLINTDKKLKVLDLCTGGGCIAVALAVFIPTAEVVATDLSTDALALAALNVDKHNLQHRVMLLQSDLFDSVSGRFDLIVSNPPYVDAADIADMGEEFLAEPPIGLASGSDGLDITRQILAEASEYLAEDGLLVTEVGNSSSALERVYPHLSFSWFEFAAGGDGVFALTRQELCGDS